MRKFIHQLPLTAALVITTVAIAGCTGGDNELERFADRGFAHSKWRQQQPVFQNVVEPITLNHPVIFTAEQATVSETARQEIQRFIGDAEVSRDDRVEIDGPRNTAGHHDPVTAARLTAVRAELEKAGFVVYVPDQPVSPLAPRRDSVEILVTRVIVVEPDCSAPQPEPGYRPEYSWSCSATANLGRMVANPTDLARGRTMTPADAENGALGIQRYKTDKVKELNQDQVDTTSQ